ncbi:hypothetical protein [Deinococcus marmoris]|uniref:Uncharacterized protein n=1 Tax=Deinococcus marmoris TaxID=249408 RepID=A0A1U7P4N0_9DEIO|nr:hypothetical protein [Deinococcus marmoris]OLV20135.1 hypothetical protein BOO71_0000433 [Deinococcus marmoris]
MDFNDKRAQELQIYFALMVPQCILDFQRRGITDAQAAAKELYAQEGFQDRLTYCEDMLHGPFDQDRRQSKLAYAQVIAAASLTPGGVEAWGLHFEAARGPFYSSRTPEASATVMLNFGPLFAGMGA